MVSNHPFIDGNKRIGIHIMQFVEKVCFSKKCLVLNPYPKPFPERVIHGATALDFGATPLRPHFYIIKRFIDSLTYNAGFPCD
ncbi:MAG: Fic family protein [[Eubacterium] siraeum]